MDPTLDPQLPSQKETQGVENHEVVMDETHDGPLEQRLSVDDLTITQQKPVLRQILKEIKEPSIVIEEQTSTEEEGKKDRRQLRKSKRFAVGMVDEGEKGERLSGEEGAPVPLARVKKYLADTTSDDDQSISGGSSNSLYGADVVLEEPADDHEDSSKQALLRAESQPVGASRVRTKSAPATRSLDDSGMLKTMQSRNEPITRMSSKLTPEELEAALEGKMTRQFFTEVLPGFVYRTNSDPEKTFGCKISRETLDFSVNHAPVPVVSINDKPSITTSAILTAGKHSVYYSVEVKKQSKFDLAVDKPSGKVKKGTSLQLNFSLRVFCTTKLYQLLQILLYRRVGLKKTKEVVGCLYLYYKIESRVSESLDYDEISKLEQIADGGFGLVYKGVWRNTEVAVKELKNWENMVPHEKDDIKKEVVLMRELKHPFIVTFMGCTILEDQPFSIVMEYIPGGSLKHLLREFPNLELGFKFKVVTDIAKGMLFLHSINICHRDIKPANMLVISMDPWAHQNIKIIDFGASKLVTKTMVESSYIFDVNDLGEHENSQDGKKDGDETRERKEKEKVSFVSRGVGTLPYQAPEILRGSTNHSVAKTDVYAYGVMLWEVFTQTEPYNIPPYNKMNRWNLEEFVKSGKRMTIPDIVPEPIASLIQRCWADKPAERPTFDVIVQELEAALPKYLPPRKDQGDNSPSFKPAIPRSVATDSSIAPSGDLTFLGWAGDISREDTMNLLQNHPVGTYLIRWTSKLQSYVLSYIGTSNTVEHIGHIKKLDDGTIGVKTDNKIEASYADLTEYVNAMRKTGLIKESYSSRRPIIKQHDEDNYKFTPTEVIFNKKDSTAQNDSKS